MQRCEFCGSDLPVNAQFCSNCGHPQFSDHKTDENEAVLPDLLLPGMLAMQGQMPSSAQAPMVQGTPQVGGVPFVHGTPAVPGNAPPSVPGLAHGAGSPAPAQAPGWEAQHRPESPPHHYQPVHHPQPTSPLHELEHQHHHRHHTGPLRDHRPHTSRLHHSAAVTSKTGMHVASKWLIVALTAIVVIGSSSIILVHALMPAIPPGLTITGTSVVRDGGILHLHGQGFQPGDSITLTIDNGLPISLAGQHETQDISQGTQRSVNVTGLSQMFIAGALQHRSVAATNIAVSSSGTFDINVTVPLSLLAGKHTIHAVDNQGSQSASMQFTVLSSELAVNPTALNFGSVEAGRTVQLSITVSNQGGTRLHWTASVDGSNTNWLTLPNSTGVIEPNGSSEAVIVTANTNGLSLGLHSATLRIHSDNGDVQIAVKLNVIPIAQSGQQAILNVPQQNLDFGQLQTGQQVQQRISIANLGNLPLKWQASSNTASATWLSLATSNGTVQTGAAPQTVQVKVNTTGLAAGSYTGTINITSNGGNATVTVKFVVTVVTPPPPPVWSVSPANLDITNCSGSSTWTCIVTLTEDANSQVGITWSPSSDQSQVTFNPPGSTLSPGKSIQVTISSIPCNHAFFTFNGSAGANPLKVSWNCTPTQPPPPPKLSITASGNCPPDSSGNYICTDTLTVSGSQGSVSWSVNAESDLPGTTFNQPNGTLSIGQSPQTVTVTIPASDCPAGGHYDYSWTGSNTSRVTVICPPPPPTLTVTPPKLSDLKGSPCTFDQASYTWSCKVTVMETSNSQGNLTWSVNSSISGVSFSSTGSTLTPGKQLQVTISSIPCVSSTTAFTFSGGAKPVTVSWTCGS